MFKKNDNCTGKISGDAGFTIIEVLIAMFIFTIAGLSVIKMQIQSIKSNSLAKEMTQASFVLSSEIENLLSLGFTDTNLNAGEYDNDTVGSVGKFNRQYEVVDMPVQGSAAGFYKSIIVTTTWNEGNSSHRIQGQAIKRR